MKREVLLLLTFTLLIKVTTGERRHLQTRFLSRPRVSSLFQQHIHKFDADHDPASSLISHNSKEIPVLKLRGGGPIEKFSKYVGDSRTRSWVVLLIAIVLDAVSSSLMKMGRDEGSIVKLVAAYAGFFTSLSGFALALGAIEVSIAYAVWAALGTAIVSVVGIALFKEKCDIYKLLGLGMIIGGVAIVESRS